MRRRTMPVRITLLLGGAVVLLVCVGMPLPQSRAAEGDAIAIVNGRPITKRQMVDTLMESHGLQIMQQLIVLELAKEQTRRLKLHVTAGDVDREFERALSKIAPEISAAGQELSDEEKRQVLNKMLQDRGLSFTEFMIGMERNAHLRAIVERNLRIDEDTLREEFARSYGEKVEVRAIRVEDINGLHEALNLLEHETDFAEVARRVSQDRDSAQRGGLLDPFAFNDDNVAPVLREAAFALAVGERTKPIKVGRWWFILKLERRLEPIAVQFADVREQVERSLRERVIPEEMNRLVVELFRTAEIRVLDQKLKPQFEELLRQNALTDAATTP